MISFSRINYVVTVELGGHNTPLLIDKGSNLTWIQCEPCDPCYDQQEPIFNPSRSPSYKPILCNSTTCNNLEYYTRDCVTKSSTCQYYIRYGDSLYTFGNLATDRLVLGTTLVKDFVFGCGWANYGSFDGFSGLLGLARSNLSMVSDTYSVFGGVFSYCLPSMNTKGSGSLMLGDDPSFYKNLTPISYTNLIANTEMPNLYFVNLTGISIDRVALQDPSLGHKEILIDSGTAITWLGPTVYHAVKTEFLKHFKGVPQAPAFSIFDTCLNLSGYKELDLEHDIPKMEMHFGTDAKLTVYGAGLLYIANIDMSQVCLVIAGRSDADEISTIGSYQQTNTRVVYNTKTSTLGFAEEICS
ncbi:hypothetical protein L1987_69713 [Smallanthus sonchifolius]|uniref:Uncharacterized protein n=1 Tax=Smallanthus sonchifolius TaxID=185202 RepID=A0ACB9B7Q7_9ASTR|nr:hypothetical protein L1987_69713 [Smallanthus sonchifolius]